jgi:hypothetical protein
MGLGSPPGVSEFKPDEEVRSIRDVIHRRVRELLGTLVPAQ